MSATTETMEDHHVIYPTALTTATLKRFATQQVTPDTEITSGCLRS